MKTLQFGMSPISWSNDDLPELGGNTPLETCLRETRAAGYTGTETGGKFPRNAAALLEVLQAHDLVLVSGWYSGRLLENSAKIEIERLKPQLELFANLGAPVIVYGETSNTVQNRRDQSLSQRPHLAEKEYPAYAERLTTVAEFCQSQGVPLSFHHHMGTAVETEQEIDRLFQFSGDAVGLLVDTGHLLFAGGDILRVIRNHGARINHFHAKDVREKVLVGVDSKRDSFLDCVLRGVFTVPGDGMIDYGPIMQALAEHDYQGWVIVEAEQDPAKADPYEYACIGHRALRLAAEAAGYSIR